MYVNVCDAFGPGGHPRGKHVLKMASSPDSLEERRRLQGRVRTQRYRDRQSEYTRARRRQSDRDRRRAARQRATEAGGVRRSLLKKGLFVLQCALTESFHAVFSNNPHKTLWFTLGSHVRTLVGVINSPRVSARGLTVHAYV